MIGRLLARDEARIRADERLRMDGELQVLQARLSVIEMYADVLVHSGDPNERCVAERLKLFINGKGWPDDA